ncbi:unnamed protein product, partial [Linum tenue]
NRRKADVLSESRHLKERIEEASVNAVIDKLIPVLKSLKELAGRLRARLYDRRLSELNAYIQKLQKLESKLDEEQRTLSDLKKKYAATMTEQRRCYSLLKAFQGECSKNETIRGQTTT